MLKWKAPRSSRRRLPKRRNAWRRECRRIDDTLLTVIFLNTTRQPTIDTDHEARLSDSNLTKSGAYAHRLSLLSGRP